MHRNRTEDLRQKSPLISGLTFGLLIAAALLQAQAPAPMLTLQQAEQMALQNHPQVQAAQHEAAYSNQQIVINRSAYYPQVTADGTGTEGNSNSRIGAGSLAASRLFDRVGVGAVVNQLITDFGRTSNLVASSRLNAQASQQNVLTARYDVLLALNQAYFNVLRAQEVVKVAEKTVEARQTTDDQITQLARSQLRSQLDVAEADVTVLKAKQIMLAAQNAVAEAKAELGRAMGTDQSANYTLADVALPPGPPATADELINQAISNRPELASLKASRDAAQKFAEAERDLSRPTVNAIAVGGFIPLVKQEGATPIPNEYEGVGANISVPVFNGHLFAARHTAAQERALEADQRLRDEQERILRDVRTAYSGSVTAYQMIDVTAATLRAAAQALDLAQGRYQYQLASIVELTTAQLDQTSAEIDNVNAKYDYEIQYAILQRAIGQLR